ncbi:MAG: hypothetical protein HYX87_05400 [Chloroflexi bacterium]|nr:hypothetical protein [Chloroflexota bacterium]
MVVCSHDFSALARSVARACGVDDPRLVILPHPLGSLPDQAIKTIIRRGHDEIMSVLTGKKRYTEVA